MTVLDAPTTTWQASVERALAGNRRATEGRFEIALASFEQFEPYGEGVARDGSARTLADFARDIGLSYATVTKYRSIAVWWYGGIPDAGMEDIPTGFAWEALRWAKVNVPRSAELRALAPRPDGSVWSEAELQLLFGRPAGPVSPSYDDALSALTSISRRLARTADDIAALDLSPVERRQLKQTVQRAMHPLGDILAALDAK